MATVADIMVGAQNRSLIRKSLSGLVLIDSMANPVATQFMQSGQFALPDTAKPLGLHSEDGLQWAAETETSELKAHGVSGPVRVDVTGTTDTLQVTPLETNIVTLSLELGVTIPDTVTISADGLTLDQPVQPNSDEFRVYALSRDFVPGAGDFIRLKIFSAASVDEKSPSPWANGDDAQSSEFTFKSVGDPKAGWAVRHWFGGPGFHALREQMGFAAATTP